MLPRFGLRISLALALAAGLGGFARGAAPQNSPGAVEVFGQSNRAETASPPPVQKAPRRPLLREGAAERGDGEPQPAGRFASGLPDLATVAASLSLVLALFFAVAWMMKKSLPKSAQPLPRDVVQVLGRSQLAGKQFAHLVRCGNKLLLVHLTPGGAETLTEITDPLEVDRLVGLCAQQNPNSATAAFREVFQEMSRERKHG